MEIVKSILIFILSFVWLFSVYGQDKKDMNPELTQLQLLTDNGITGEVKDKIIRHIKQNLPLQTVEFILSNNKEGEKDLIFSEISSAPFAESVKFYSLHHRGFAHWSEIYVEFNGKFYTSLKKNDFENFLKEYDFINKTNSLDLFIIAYRNFNIKDSAIHPNYIVTEKYLKENQENLTKYEAGYPKLSYKELHFPKERKNKNGIEISFYVDNPLIDKITLIKASVSSNYSFQWESRTYRQDKPVEIN